MRPHITFSWLDKKGRRPSLYENIYSRRRVWFITQGRISASEKRPPNKSGNVLIFPKRAREKRRGKWLACKNATSLFLHVFAFEISRLVCEGKNCWNCCSLLTNKLFALFLGSDTSNVLGRFNNDNRPNPSMKSTFIYGRDVFGRVVKFSNIILYILLSMGAFVLAIKCVSI